MIRHDMILTHIWGKQAILGGQTRPSPSMSPYVGAGVSYMLATAHGPRVGPVGPLVDMHEVRRPVLGAEKVVERMVDEGQR